jgi:copper(I)-binding protein
LLLAAALTAACAGRDTGLHIERAALATTTDGTMSVLYFTLRNDGPTRDTVRRMRVDSATAVTMHTPRQHALGVESGVADSITVVPIAPRSVVRFAPGGLHAMVQAPALTLRRGMRLRVVADLASGDSVVGVVPVVGYADLDSVLGAPSRWERVTALAARLGAAAGVQRRIATDDDVAAGRELYLANGCASCHGALGHGDGPVAKTLNPRPRDFRDAAAFKLGRDASAIAQAIGGGIPGGGGMPPFPHLSRRERESLARYLISLRSRN